MTMNEKHLREFREQVFRKNPGIKPRLVEGHKRLKKELAKIGVETKREYDLEPPLGRDRLRYKKGADIDNSSSMFPVRTRLIAGIIAVVIGGCSADESAQRDEVWGPTAEEIAKKERQKKERVRRWRCRSMIYGTGSYRRDAMRTMSYHDMARCWEGYRQGDTYR